MGRVTLKTAIKKYVKGFVPINIIVNNVTLAPNELLKGKNAIVTGASRGIGKSIAKSMIASGATVIALGRNPEHLSKAKEEICSEKYIPFPCDVSDVSRLSEYIREISSLLDDGKIDILVNCAGVKNGNDERFFDYTPEDFDFVVDTNLKGTFFWCQQVSKHMISNNVKGHIVNVISIKGLIGEASPYSVSKWGCTSLTKGLARILAPKGIVVNGLAPGGTKTDMADLSDDSMVHLSTPSMRLADSNEMANVAVFLASDLGNNIVGDVIISDGGQILQYGNDRL
ncbi:MAG: SDR family NAD(P)-dependent oxidoreductase [Lachnospiraceae bacterium]